jgi:hypothetical protein
MERNDLIERLRAARVGTPCHGEVFALKIVPNPLCAEAADRIEADAVTIASLSGELAEAEKKGAEDWQPIETAPKDGTQILVYVPDGRREKDRVQAGSCARNLNKQDIWIIGNQFGFDVGEPTHWRPLPAPPRDLSQGGQP